MVETKPEKREQKKGGGVESGVLVFFPDRLRGWARPGLPAIIAGCNVKPSFLSVHHVLGLR